MKNSLFWFVISVFVLIAAPVSGQKTDGELGVIKKQIKEMAVRLDLDKATTKSFAEIAKKYGTQVEDLIENHAGSLVKIKPEIDSLNQAQDAEAYRLIPIDKVLIYDELIKDFRKQRRSDILRKRKG